VPEINRTPSGNQRGGNRGPGRGPRRARSTTPEGGPGAEAAALELSKASELSEKVVFINRSAKVVKGGRRFSFSALVVAGDKHGRVGVGLGKAVEVSEAIRKGGDMAKQRMVSVSLKESTIPHAVLCRHGGARVILRPASPGTGLIAGPTVRAVLESVGIKDVLSKSLGSDNPANVVKATIAGLLQLRSREEVYRARGLQIRKHVAPVVVAAPVAVVAPAAPVSANVPPPAPATPAVPGPAEAGPATN
jgi:small subunit ribosomal protein S5